VIERLARGVSVSEEWNVRENYQRLLKEGEKTSLSAVRKRALQVEQIFLPELRALFKIGLRERINILNIRGSSAGAFGWPQFMPLAYLRFSVDGNKDGRISLFNPADAIFSVANYLKYHGWRNNNNYRDQLKVIWHYNKSTPYGRAVLEVARITSRR
jgi:membrane-bound lytic murein transglycosylase B